MTTKKDGFTLLELVVVIIVMGVLASMALPTYFRNVEFSRATEALNVFASSKRAADRCSLMSGVGQDYSGCTTFDALAIEQPGLVGGAHFCYSINRDAGLYTIVAERNDRSNPGDGAPCDASGAGTGVGDLVILELVEATGMITKTGTGAFEGIR